MLQHLNYQIIIQDLSTYTIPANNVVLIQHQRISFLNYTLRKARNNVADYD